MTDTLPTGAADPLMQSTQAAVRTGMVSGAQTMPVAEKLAQAISMGAAPMPTTPDQWNALIAQFTTPLAQQSSPSPQKINPEAVISPGGTPTASAAKGTATPTAAATSSAGGGDLQAFLYGERMAESSNNYTVGEGGAYGMIEPYWQGTAKDAGYGQYANQPAGSAPPAVQDAVASYLANKNFQQYGSWANAAQAWYNPATVGQTGYTPQGNVLTMGQYSDRVMGFMQQYPGGGTPAASPNVAANPAQGGGSSSAIQFAQSKIGENYVWGGESDSGWDCSGLVQAAYKSAGVDLPRVAQDQYNATTKVPNGQPLQAGDLVFFGTSTSDISHVGIYVGNGQMIDAPNSDAKVRTENYQWADYVGATRPTDATGVTTLPTTAAVGNAAAVSSGEVKALYFQALSHIQAEMAKLVPGGLK